MRQEDKIALVMHGGGMRGAYGAGVVNALDRMIGLERVAIVMGTSAGAANALGAAAGKVDAIREVWTRHLHVREFINAYRLKWMTNIDYLMKVLDKYGMTNALMQKATARLYIACTHFIEGSTRYFSNHNDILGAVRASVSIPILSQTPVMVEGEPYLDGGISTGVSDLIREAIAKGAARVIAVDLSSSVGWYQKLGLQWYSRNVPEGLKHTLGVMLKEPYPEAIAPDPRVFLIRPRETMVTRLQYSLEKLTATYERGFNETLNDYNLKTFLT